MERGMSNKRIVGLTFVSEMMFFFFFGVSETIVG